MSRPSVVASMRRTLAGVTVEGLDDLIRQLDFDAVNTPTDFVMLRGLRLVAVKITPRERKQA